MRTKQAVLATSQTKFGTLKTFCNFSGKMTIGIRKSMVIYYYEASSFLFFDKCIHITLRYIETLFINLQGRN